MDESQFQRIAKALADPRRFKILETIAAAGAEMCCGEVVCKFPVTQATVSHHLNELADAGLVETRTEGQFKLLRTRPDVLAEYIEQLRQRVGLKKGARATERSVSSTGASRKSPRR
jgi:ArsR family transcriptional regulator